MPAWRTTSAGRGRRSPSWPGAARRPVWQVTEELSWSRGWASVTVFMRLGRHRRKPPPTCGTLLTRGASARRPGWRTGPGLPPPASVDAGTGPVCWGRGGPSRALSATGGEDHEQRPPARRGIRAQPWSGSESGPGRTGGPGAVQLGGVRNHLPVGGAGGASREGGQYRCPTGRAVGDLCCCGQPQVHRRTNVLRVRRALAGDGDLSIVTWPAGLLRGAQEMVDAGLAESLIGAGRQAMAGGDAAAAVRLLRQALDLLGWSRWPSSPTSSRGGRSAQAGGAARGGAWKTCST